VSSGGSVKSAARQARDVRPIAAATAAPWSWAYPVRILEIAIPAAEARPLRAWGAGTGELAAVCKQLADLFLGCLAALLGRT
jgi:hypothetical protein